MTIKDLRIEKLVYNGYGLGFQNSNPIFVSYAVPGDLVDAELTRKSRKVSFARLTKLHERSNLRRQITCEVFGKCGGCNWLNINYQEQITAKEKIINEIFRKCELPQKIKVVASDQEFNYRNKCFYPVSKVKDEIKIGLFATRSHQVISHKNCQLQPQSFSQIIKIFRSYLLAANAKIYDEKSGTGNIRHLGIRYSFAKNEFLLIVVTKKRKLPFSKQLIRVMRGHFPNIVGIVQNINPIKTNVILGKESKLIFGRSYLEEEIGRKKFQYNFDSFFQINPMITKKMYDLIKENIEMNSTVIDAFCGVGSIGIYCSEKIKSLRGFEINAEAVEQAKKNAHLNEMRVAEFFVQNLESRNKIDGEILIVDPPRKGLSTEFRQNIPISIRKIIYVSCDPNTQFRDLQDLFAQGFALQKIKAFDMFPQTYHIETVCILERK